MTCDLNHFVYVACITVTALTNTDMVTTPVSSVSVFMASLEELQNKFIWGKCEQIFLLSMDAHCKQLGPTLVSE